jgi:hypothetical protein
MRRAKYSIREWTEKYMAAKCILQTSDQHRNLPRLILTLGMKLLFLATNLEVPVKVLEQ